MPPEDALTDAATAICARHGNAPAALVEILHDLQAELGFVPEGALPAIAECLNISRAEVHGVASFYHDFRSEPPPPVIVKLCRAEACQAMGAEALAQEAEAKLASDERVAITPVYCLGNCALAPAALLNGRLIGRLTIERLLGAVQEAEA